MRGTGYDSGVLPDEMLADQDDKPRGMTTTGMAVAGACAAVVAGICGVCWPFIAPAIRKHCLPYVPATDTQVRRVVTSRHTHPAQLDHIMKACRQVSARTIVDLGSGDGRIVIRAAQEGYKVRMHHRCSVPTSTEKLLQATGYELNPWLVLYSK